MKTAFYCSQCQTRLVAKASLAGRTSRCPKCGHQVVVPAAAAGDWRVAVSQQLEPQKPLAPRAAGGGTAAEIDTGYRLKSLTPVGTPKRPPPAKTTEKSRARSAASAVSSAATTAQQARGARGGKRHRPSPSRSPRPASHVSPPSPTSAASRADDDEELAGLFGDMGEVAFEFNPPEPVVAPSQVRSGFSDVLRAYRSVFSLLARGTKGISEASYTISFILLIQAVTGGILRHHGLVSLALGLIVVLNVVGFVGDLASLVMLSFRKDPMQGLLFLVPPYGVYYLWTDWKRYQEVVGRMRIPLLMLAMVGVAYAFVPWLSVDSEQPAAGDVAGVEATEGEAGGDAGPETGGSPPTAPAVDDSRVGYGVGLVETAAEWVWSLVGGEPKQLFHSQAPSQNPSLDAEPESEE